MRIRGTSIFYHCGRVMKVAWPEVTGIKIWDIKVVDTYVCIAPCEFQRIGSLMCLWQALKLWKMQLEVRSFNVTWRRDLWGHRVIVFFGNVWTCWLNSYGKFDGAKRRRFSLSAKSLRGADNRPLPFVRGLRVRNGVLAPTCERICSTRYPALAVTFSYA